MSAANKAPPRGARAEFRLCAIAHFSSRHAGYEGASADIEDVGERVEVLCQAGETDARFLRRLAAAEEFEFFVDDTGFHWHARRQGTPPTHVFHWHADPGRGDVLDVTVESDLVRRVGRVRTKGRDPERKETLDESATSDTVARDTLGELVEVVDPESGETFLQAGDAESLAPPDAVQERNATESVRPSTAATAADARREAGARFRRAERATVKLTLRVVGDPTLRAKSVVELRGCGSLLDGKYYATSVKHEVSGSGYVCSLALARDAKGRLARRAAGMPQGGTRNTAEKPKPGETTVVERVDGETGGTWLEFRADGPASADPEGGGSET